MSDMAGMQMPLPDNTLPMMTGDGPFGALEMGGMFSVVKVRDDLRPGDYRDPGWFRHPAGTVPSEYTAGDDGDAPRTAQPEADAGTLQVRKPTGHDGH
jgi:hypothetical protein